MAGTGLYLHLFKLETDRNDGSVLEARNGPVLGPFHFVEVVRGREIKFAFETTCADERVYGWTMNQEGLLYYDGRYYDDFSIQYHDPQLVLIAGLATFGPEKAIQPAA